MFNPDSLNFKQEAYLTSRLFLLHLNGPQFIYWIHNEPGGRGWQPINSSSNWSSNGTSIRGGGVFKLPHSISQISFHLSEAGNVDILTFVVLSYILSNSGLYIWPIQMIVQHHFPPSSVICFWNCQKTMGLLVPHYRYHDLISQLGSGSWPS